MRTIVMVAASAIALSACIPSQPEIYQSSQTKGDFGLLSCNQLAAAEGSVRQRAGSVNEDGVYVFGVFTPEGLPVAERQDILASNADELGTLKAQRNCRDANGLPAAGQLAPSSAQTGGAVATAATTPLVESEPITAGRFLQVATFESVENRDTALAALRAKGVNTNSQPITISGRVYHRILIGPLKSQNDIVQADLAAAELGLRDGFFVDG